MTRTLPAPPLGWPAARVARYARLGCCTDRDRIETERLRDRLTGRMWVTELPRRRAAREAERLRREADAGRTRRIALRRRRELLWTPPGEVVAAVRGQLEVMA